jgi:hypothetical protein
MLSADVTGSYAAVSDLDIRRMSVQRRMTRDSIKRFKVTYARTTSTELSQSKITSMRRWKDFCKESDCFYAMAPTSNTDFVIIKFFLFYPEYSEFIEVWSQGQGYDEGCRFYEKNERIDCGESSSSFYAEAKPSAYLDSFHPTLFQY